MQIELLEGIADVLSLLYSVCVTDEEDLMEADLVL
jgi:hypothetical protein